MATTLKESTISTNRSTARSEDRHVGSLRMTLKFESLDTGCNSGCFAMVITDYEIWQKFKVFQVVRPYTERLTTGRLATEVVPCVSVPNYQLGKT